MHLSRESASKKLPIKRKGTKYIVRTFSHVQNSVPVLIALRDMLHLARTNEEVKKMIHHKLLKINGRAVKDYRESIRLFNVFTADRDYKLVLLNTGKFAFEENKGKGERLCKITGKCLVSKGKVQLNMHDGSNALSNEKININDSVYLDFSGKIKKHISLEKGKEVFVLSGKYTGQNGKVESLAGKKVNVRFSKDSSAELSASQVVAV